jgi:hypothetical protein
MGVAVTPRLARQVSLRLSVDAHHIPVNSGGQYYGLTGVEPIKMMHGGVEVFFANPLTTSPISFRAGINQGFWTAGGTITSGIIHVEFASYGVDVSSTAKQIEDRRWIANISLAF